METEGTVPDLDKIRRLAALMERAGLSRLSLVEDGVTLLLEQGTAVAPVMAHHAAPVWMPQPVAGHAPAPTVEAPPAAPEGVPLPSPTTGTFYRAPSPGDPPFVEVGDTVELGQTIGIIMAMKVMSEIPAEAAGEVIAIPAVDGELVQSGAPLVIVKPAE
jgi:acetyl-CoA carboxylase biotin carboxyl carrier protein